MKNFFRAIWEKMNGKKLVSGVGLAIVGMVLNRVEGLETVGETILGVGFAMIGIGGTHKIVKQIKSNNDLK